ncbi:hypothetical protein IWW48_006018 [Coemansia sp. RSA 1200]|nr:hypothetical protein IWW48_006018 [Coemansia sp. RSA 1200]
MYVAHIGVSLAEYYAIRRYLADADAGFCHGKQHSERVEPWLANDCLRLGVVWPTVNLALALGMCINLLVLPFHSLPLTREAGARSPALLPDRLAGVLSFHDNRTRIGKAALTVSLAAVANGLIFATSMGHRRSHEYMYWHSQAVFWVAASLVLIRDLANHKRSWQSGTAQTDAGCGVFHHWSIVVGVLVQFVLGALLEGYYAFFTGKHIGEAPGSTAHSRFVAVSGAISLIVALLSLSSHRRGFYLSLGRQKTVDVQSGDMALLPGSEVDSDEYKTPLTRQQQPNQMPLVESPESLCSPLDRLTFGWVTPVLRLGTRYTITSADLYSLGSHDRPLHVWRRYTQCRKPKQSLLLTLVITFGPQIIVQAVLAFVSAVLAYAGPFFLQRILRSIRLHGSDDGGSGEPATRRLIYLDAIGLLVTSILHSMSTNRVLWIGRKISLRLHGLLVAELSSKALLRRSKSSIATKTGDSNSSGTDDAKGGDADTTASSDGRMANMLTSDLESVGHISSYLNDIYTLPIGFFLGSWYLYRLLGVSALIGLTLSAIYYPLTRLMVKYLIKYQKRLMTLDDERVTMITEMFQGIRAVKLFGWQSRFIAKVRAKREEEISAYWTLMLFQLPVSFVRSVTTSLILVAILAIYTLGFGHTLTADIVFPSITVFSMVSSTFNSIPWLFRWMSGCYVSLSRIESFMTQAQIQDLEDRVDPADHGELALGFSSASFVWDADAAVSKQKRNKKEQNRTSQLSLATMPAAETDAAVTPRKTSGASSTRIGTIRGDDNDSLSELTPLLDATNNPSASYDSASVSSTEASPCGSSGAAENGCTATATATAVDGRAGGGKMLATSLSPLQKNGGKRTAQFALTDISLRFPVGGLSIIAGPTGSGKSSLLAALIGEMTLVSGRIVLPTADPLSHPSTEAAPDNWMHNSDSLTQQQRQQQLKYAHVAELAGQGLMMRDIAYVSQEAWLRNATIRENILFGETYDKDRYEEVLRMCALKPDLRILGAGDMTEIGERGVTLSGGQKQRVSLARAVYSSRRILLIDDCLSAVDAHTGKHILSNCLLGKTQLMQGRTRVLVTHHVAACLPHCDFVAVLNDGRVAYSGLPEHVQRGGFAAGAAAVDADDLGSADCSNGSAAQKDSERGVAAEDGSSQSNVNDSRSEDEYNAARRAELAEQRAAEGGGAQTMSAHADGALVEDEECEHGYVRPEIWIQYMRMCGPWWYWVTVAAFIFAGRFASIAQDYWVRLWMSSTSAPAGGSGIFALDTGRGVAAWLGVYVAAGMAITTLRLGASVNENAGSMRAARKYHEQLFTRVVNATPRFFDKTPIGRVISRFSRDMRTIDDAVIVYITILLAQITQVGSVFVIISVVTPPFIAIAVAMCAAYAMLAVYYLNATRELKRMDSISMSPLLSLFSELITGVESIRAFGAQSQYTLEAMGRVDAHNRPYYLMWAANRWLCARIELSGCIVSFSATVLMLASLDRIDAGLAGFVLMYAISFSDYMLWFIRNYSECEINMNAVERVNQYLNLDQEAAAFADAQNSPPPSWPATGDVVVSDLVAEYVPGKPVLHGLSFSVSHGEKIGVVGRTGAGKSTLSLAFLRFIEPASGSIVIDGIDVACIGLEQLRRNVTIIPQDPSLFNGTIRFNLDPFDEFPEELLWDALKRSHLVYTGEPESPTDSLDQQATPTDPPLLDSQNGDPSDDGLPVVSRMSGIFTSLDAEVKENGKNLSLGQRQLVALARALVRRSKLIIMDEATASVDFDTDNRIQQTIRGSEFANSTLLCIAHRLRTVIDYDRVLVLDNGRVAEFDTPYNLLQRKDGIFRSMCDKSGEYDHLLSAAAASSRRT